MFLKIAQLHTKKTLCALYYSLRYSRVNYGIITWENPSNTYLNNVTVRMNGILRAIKLILVQLTKMLIIYTKTLNY